MIERSQALNKINELDEFNVSVYSFRVIYFPDWMMESLAEPKRWLISANIKLATHKCQISWNTTLCIIMVWVAHHKDRFRYYYITTTFFLRLIKNHKLWLLMHVHASKEQTPVAKKSFYCANIEFQLQQMRRLKNRIDWIFFFHNLYHDHGERHVFGHMLTKSLERFDCCVFIVSCTLNIYVWSILEIEQKENNNLIVFLLNLRAIITICYNIGKKKLEYIIALR